MSVIYVHILCSAIFFVTYGFAAYFLLRWMARTRVAALTSPSRFNVRHRALAFLGILWIAVMPPFAELSTSVLLQVDAKPDWAFFAFCSVWIASLFPGVIVSRTTLRAGGINPDKEP